MNKTNVIVNIGIDCGDSDFLKKVISGGVDVLRLNLNFVDHEFCKNIISKVRDIDKELGTVTSIMFDTVGPCIKTGKFVNGSAYFTEGTKIRIYDSNILGDETKLFIDYYDLIDGVRCNSLIKLDNGSVILNVLDKGSDYLLCEVLSGGSIVDNSSVYLEDGARLPFLSDRDKDDIRFAGEMGVDFLALSLVNSVEDVLDVNDLLIEMGNDHMSIISKIERNNAIDVIDDIIKVSDGILLSRGDLGVDVSIERIPGIQKMIINKCHFSNKISIISTDVLSSIAPSKSQVSDIANAVLDGCDAILLSFDSTDYDLCMDTLSVMKRVIVATELDIDYYDLLNRSLRSDSLDITGGLAYSVVDMANRLSCKCIVTPTISGYTARKMSRFRPSCPILALCPDINVVKSLKLYYGIYPIFIEELKSLDDAILRARDSASNFFELDKDDKFIITGGYPFSKTKHTNFIKIEEI
jgi:pyruvate kinase